MKTIIGICCVALILAASLSAQTSATASTVHLRDGRTVTGTILGDMSGESIKLKTDDGSILVFQMAEVIKISAAEESPAVPIGSSTPPSRIDQTQPVVNQQSATPQLTRKEPSSALLYSVLLSGGGQFYNGDVTKGLVQLGGTILGLVLFVSYFPETGWVADDYYWASYGYETESGDEFLSYGGLALALGMKIWSIIDAPSGARKYNERHGLVSVPVGDDHLYVNIENVKVAGHNSVGMKVGLSF
ncbi:hypothetical protein KQH82_03100 [bacterium]|nr:hypothetical protein [bacterium]